MRGWKAAFDLLESGNRQFDELMASSVHDPEHSGEQGQEQSQKDKHERSDVVLDGSEHAAVGKNREQDEEIEDLQSLLCIELEVIPYKLSGVHGSSCALARDRTRSLIAKT